MIKEFVAAWDANKGILEEYFRKNKQPEYCEYETLVKLLFTLVVNPTMVKSKKFSTDDMTTVDHGSYQGTQIFILHRDDYQPTVSDYVYTNNYYGSCSGCDTLQGIHKYNDGLPNEQQIKDYMALCLGLLQSCTWMVDGADKKEDSE